MPRMDEIVLRKGANCEVPSEVESLQVVVAWDEPDGEVDVDAAALLLAGDRRVRSDAEFVFFNQPASPDGSVRLVGRSSTESGSHELVRIDLVRIDPEVDCVAVTASLGEGDFGSLAGLRLRILDAGGEPLARYDIDDADAETAFVFCEVYRRGPGWKVRAVGQGWDSGLAGLASDFGVTVDDGVDSDVPPVDDAPLGEEADGAVGQVDAAEAEPSLVEPVDGVPDESLDPDGVAQVIEFPATPTGRVRPTRPRPGVRTSKRAAVVVRPPRLKLAGAETWQPSRLFSISGVGTAEEQEKRATSALLATVMAVPAFGRALSARFGAPAGPVETFLEVPFGLGESTVYPDGVLRVARGGKLWTAVLEVKTGSGQLLREQVERYLDVARQEGYDTVVTLSNEIAAHPGEHPVLVDKRKLRRATLTHISWAEVLHEAKFTLHHRGVGDPLQAWILHEFIRYIEHPRSGAATFEDMGPSWVPVREAIHAGTLRGSDKKVPAVAAAWVRLVRHLCLRLSSDLGVNVVPSVARKLAGDPAAHVQSIVTRLASEGALEAVIKVPLAAGPLTVTADLRTSQVRTSVAVRAPQEGNGQRRIAWLLRQLKDAPDALLVEAVFAARTETACEQLKDVRDNPTMLLPDRGVEISAFRLSLASAMGTKRSGQRGAFVPSVTSAVEAFYSSVVQPLKAWQPAAPKLSEDVESEAIETQESEVSDEAIS